MTQINQYTQTVGRFKDIRDVLFEIEGTENKYQDMAKIVKAKDHTHYWVEKKYATGTSNSSQHIEGATLTGEAPPTKTEYSNITEENAVVYDLTDRMQAIAKAGGIAGVKNAIKDGIRDAMLELKARVERSAINGTLSAGDATHKDQMQGIVPMALSFGVTSYSADTAFGTTFEGTFRTFLQDVRTAGGLRSRSKTLLMSYATKDLFSAGVRGMVTAVNSVAEKATVYMDVEIYKCQFGDLALMAHDVMVDGKIIVLEKDYAKIAVLQPTHPVDVARTGTAEIISYACDNTQAYEKPSTLGHLIVS